MNSGGAIWIVLKLHQSVGPERVRTAYLRAQNIPSQGMQESVRFRPLMLEGQSLKYVFGHAPDLSFFVPPQFFHFRMEGLYGRFPSTQEHQSKSPHVR